MIQRRQSIFLLLGAVCALLTFKLPVATYTELKTGTAYVFRTTGVVMNDTPVSDFTLKMPVWALFVIIAATLLVGIFLFKNRVRQMRVVRASYLMILLSAFIMFSQHLSVVAYLSAGKRVETSFGPSMFLPLAILAFVFLALRSIKQDEDLVRSMDRLR